jgi:hypothetical protein
MGKYIYKLHITYLTQTGLETKEIPIQKEEYESVCKQLLEKPDKLLLNPKLKLPQPALINISADNLIMVQPVILQEIPKSRIVAPDGSKIKKSINAGN